MLRAEADVIYWLLETLRIIALGPALIRHRLVVRSDVFFFLLVAHQLVYKSDCLDTFPEVFCRLYAIKTVRSFYAWV